MILYFTKGACSLAIRILINELNLPCDYVAVDLQTKKLETGEDYYPINPKGYVPALQTDDKKIITENAAIHLYLAEKYQKNNLLPANTDFNRYRILEWLIFVTTELHKGFGPLFNPKISQDFKNDIFIPKLIKAYALVEKSLEKNKFLAGAEYTLPDGYLFLTLLWAKKMMLDFNDFPKILKYYEEMKERPSIKKSLSQEGLS